MEEVESAEDPTSLSSVLSTESMIRCGETLQVRSTMKVRLDTGQKNEQSVKQIKIVFYFTWLVPRTVFRCCYFPFSCVVCFHVG